MGALADVQRLQPGDVFAGRYEVEQILGVGGMGAVYRALDRSLGEPIALKLMSLGREPSAISMERFRQEVKLARRVTHPCVARVFDLGEQDGALYMTMELIEGGTLRSLLAGARRLSPQQAARIARAVCEGLSAAHGAGVLHRDIKPTNVLLSREGRVAIADFGVARSLTDARPLTVGPIGTPSYMAPEQACSGMVDARTDIYAVGLLLYEMLAGERPDGSGEQRLSRLLCERGAPAAPAALAALVLRCMAHAPDERPASAAEVILLLDRAMAWSAEDLAEAPTAGAPWPPKGNADTAGGTAVQQRATPEPAAAAWTPREATPPRVATLGSGGDARSSSESTSPRTLAVLPFRYRGPGEDADLSEALTDELVDVLSKNRGLSVVGSGATAAYQKTRDARAIGRELGAHGVIDGTVQRSRDKLRVTVRLVDAATGVQLWCETHEGGVSDLFDLQTVIARKVAEELRVEITTLTHRLGASDEAMEHYRTARRRLRVTGYTASSSAAAGFARCIDLAPSFTPAIAWHAIACLRSWFYNLGADTTGWAETAARQSVARALESAPELAETHFAAALLATHCGDFQGAARALTRALHIAPTYADALEYLGLLQCEAGQPEAGIRRLRLADELDPSLNYCLMFIARHHALMGDLAAFESTLAELDQRRRTFTGTFLRVRVAAWYGDIETIRRRLGEIREHPDTPWTVLMLYGRSFLGEAGEVELDQGLSATLARTHNPRFIAMVTQLATEVYAGRGRLDAAHLYLLRAAAGTLVDIEWLERCPLLAPLRSAPDFAEVRRRVRCRADAIWAP